MKKHIDITIPTSVLKDRLSKALKAGKEENHELVAVQIINHLEATEMGLSALMMSFMGMEEKTNWIVGDECMIDPDNISDWTYDKKKTETAGMLHKGHLKGKIKAIDFRKKKAVKFEFEGVERYNDKDKVKSFTEDVPISSLKSDSDLVLVRPDLGSML